jgi:S1-C subfamily serine protease
MGAIVALLCMGDWSFAAGEAEHVNDSVDTLRRSETIARTADPVAQESAASIYKKSIHAIFTVRSDRELGTGFTFAAGYLVTNAHVVADSTTVEVEEQGGNTFRARVVKKNTARDFAILEPEGVRPFTTLVPLLAGDAPEIGEALVVIGSPGGMKGTVTTGIVSQTYPDGVVQMNVAVNPGNSGGPVFDLKGCVFGIATYKYTNGEGISFAIPISWVTSELGS